MPAARGPRRVAVVGAGWAGLAAAVEATRQGDAVTLFEMSHQGGGRAREVTWEGQSFDNGQHILIGAYTETLRLMRLVGADIDAHFLRTPLRITYPEGAGLHLRGGAPATAFALAVLRYSGWRWGERLALLRAAAGWRLGGFDCDAALTVSTLTGTLPPAVRAELIDPLCVAALNTPSHEASARVFLRVLHDALLSGPGSADLLMPRVSLGAVFPQPALRWLAEAGAAVRQGHRVERLEPHDAGWQVDGEAFDHVVLATTAPEAARLAAPLAPPWARTASALVYEPIVTVYAHSTGATLPAPMVALREGPDAPAQFAFDRGQLGGPSGQIAFVISGARAWVDAGHEATAAATLRQAEKAFGRFLRGPLALVKVLAEKRATFRCTPAWSGPPWSLLRACTPPVTMWTGPTPPR